MHEQFVACCIEQNRTIPIKSNEDVKKYAFICKAVAEEERVTFLDLYAIFAAQPNLVDLFVDGLHLSLNGAKLLHQHLAPLVLKKVKQYAKVDSIELMVKFPYWNEIDAENPEKSFKKW